MCISFFQYTVYLHNPKIYIQLDKSAIMKPSEQRFGTFQREREQH